MRCSLWRSSVPVSYGCYRSVRVFTEYPVQGSAEVTIADPAHLTAIQERCVDEVTKILRNDMFDVEGVKRFGDLAVDTLGNSWRHFCQAG